MKNLLIITSQIFIIIFLKIKIIISIIKDYFNYGSQLIIEETSNILVLNFNKKYNFFINLLQNKNNY